MGVPCAEGGIGQGEFVHDVLEASGVFVSAVEEDNHAWLAWLENLECGVRAIGDKTDGRRRGVRKSGQ
jgi:hypothetical protein